MINQPGIGNGWEYEVYYIDFVKYGLRLSGSCRFKIFQH
jgi:hypothetical protein